MIRIAVNEAIDELVFVDSTRRSPCSCALLVRIGGHEVSDYAAVLQQLMGQWNLTSEARPLAS